MFAKRHNEEQSKPLNEVLKAKFFFFTELIFGLTLIGVAMSGFILRFLATHGAAALPSSQKVAGRPGSSTDPSEIEPTAEEIARYSVPDDQPKSIRIKSAGIFGLIQKVGLTNENALAVPTNIFFAGWYVNGAKPGQDGLSVLDGHVLGSYKDAIFRHLGDVKARDEIEIEFGDGSIKKFIVITTKKLPVDKSAQYLFSKKADVTAQLNLITCDGIYDKSNHTYSGRIVVSAKLES